MRVIMIKVGYKDGELSVGFERSTEGKTNAHEKEVANAIWQKLENLGELMVGYAKQNGWDTATKTAGK